MHLPNSSPLLSKFSRIWIPTIVAIIILNFTFVVFQNNFYWDIRKEKWNPPVAKSIEQQYIAPPPPPPPPPPTSLELIKELYAPLRTAVDAPLYTSFEGIEYKLTNPPIWTVSLGSELCIVDIDTRPLNGPNQIMNSSSLDWDNAQYATAGMMNHYLYAKIHGYTYHTIRTTPLEDRSVFWTKIPALAHTLSEKKCRITLSIDADATFMNLNLPLEWLFNRWNITQETSLTLPLDPDEPQNKDRAHGNTNLNCGFVIAQNLPRTHEILEAWQHCPDLPDRFPDCEKWKVTWPAEQAAFGEYVRYAFNGTEDVKEIPCDEANGFPGSGSECRGVFVRHHWSDKTLVRGVMNKVFMRGVMERAHGGFIDEMDGIFVVDEGERNIVGDFGDQRFEE